MKPAPIPWMRLRARRAARQHRAVLGLDRDHPEAGLARLQHRADPGQRAAGADAADHDIDRAAGVASRFPRRSCGGGSPGLAGFWNCCGMKASGSDLDDLLGPGDGAAHALRRRGQLELGAEQQQHLAAFDRHAVRHRQDQPIALGGADKGERDPGIARGRLDQHGAGLDAAGGLGRLDHRQPDAVLDRGERVEELAFAEDVGLDPGTRRRAGARRTSGVAPIVSTMLS